MAKPTYTKLAFEDLKGWPDDDHQAAFDVFAKTCADITDSHWSVLSDFLCNATDPRQFFEAFFCPLLIEDGTPAHFTGYFEPELVGRHARDDQFRFPIYAVPDEFVPGGFFYTRREIDQGKALSGKGLELAWLADSLDAFFLHVQGSGRIAFPDGTTMRVGFAGKNGHPYTSIGAKLISWGQLTEKEVSPQSIRDWVHANGDNGTDLLMRNDSYVFFRVIDDVPNDKGPLGAMQKPVTPERTIAVDPEFVPLGAPVWVEMSGETPLNRLMVAQDVGSAIKGAQRADIFVGTGDVAGVVAGAINDGGRMVVLLPTTKAQKLLQDET